MKLSLFLFASSSACSDIFAADWCNSECTGALFSCQANCSTNDCNLQCESEFKECSNDCPCGRSCPQVSVFDKFDGFYEILRAAKPAQANTVTIQSFKPLFLASATTPPTSWPLT